MQDQQAILNNIIIGYRKCIEARYQYDDLASRFDLPDSFDAKRVELFREYFLEYIYPHPDKREALNEAFDSLDTYIKQPEKLVRMVMDSASLLFKHGRYLRRILNAAIKALKSYRSATRFEKKIANIAARTDIRAPYSIRDINSFIQKLDREDIDRFVEDSQSLFEVLHDRTLVKKIKDVVTQLIQKMKKRPHIYAEVEVKGMEIGRDIIVNGDALFDQLTVDEQHRIFEVVLQIEKEVLGDLFEDQ